MECFVRQFREGNLHHHADTNTSRSFGNDTDDKPIAIVHVGPEKTGTTAIQQSILRYSGDLAKANYIHIAERVHFFANCVLTLKEYSANWKKNCKNDPHLVDQMQRNITMARTEGKNIIISSESLDRVHLVDPQKIRELLEGFDIHIVVTYRRFYEWNLSRFGQIYRKGKDWKDWDHWPKSKKLTADLKNIVAYLSVWRLKDHYAGTYSLEVFRMYKEAGFNTHMLDYHASGGDIVRSLFCLPEMNASNVCTRASSETALQANMAEPTIYDEIGVAAYEAGLIDGGKIGRPQAREIVRQCVEKTLGWKEDDLPKICVNGRELELLERISVMAESLALPELNNGNIKIGEPDWSLQFERYKTTKFCSVDAKKVLAATPLRSCLSVYSV
jgi:hypothetical protein